VDKVRKMRKCACRESEREAKDRENVPVDARIKLSHTKNDLVKIPLPNGNAIVCVK